MTRTNQTPEKKVLKLFNQISPTYDHMNNVISLGLHRRWRKLTMAKLQPKVGQLVIDVCCGTGDFAISLAKAVGPTGHVVGVDFSDKMLQIARKKIFQKGFSRRVSLVKADAMKLPFSNNTFSLATIGFGLRNVPDAKQVLSEMRRVITLGGQVACLETSRPQNLFIYFFWNLYFKIVPMLAKLLVNHYRDYKYLQVTTKRFVSAKTLVKIFKQVGLKKIYYKVFTWGAATLHIGYKS